MPTVRPARATDLPSVVELWRTSAGPTRLPSSVEAAHQLLHHDAGASWSWVRPGRYPGGMTDVEIFVDPSCPWAWLTSEWLKEVAAPRDLSVTLRSFCLEIRDDYGVAPTMPEEYRDTAIAAHALSHRMLRIFEAARARAGDESVDALYAAWGPRFFVRGGARDDSLLSDCLAACHLDADLLDAADDEKWDAPILEAMDIAYAFGGDKTQTPTIVVRANPPHGFKGPVMAPAPTGAAAVRLWDAVQVLSEEPGFFEITRPRANRPRPSFD